MLVPRLGRHRASAPRWWAVVAAALVVSIVAPVARAGSGSDAAPAPGAFRAGAAAVDATWHLGASAGQYASDGASVHDHGVDPAFHSTRRAPAYGLQSRSSVRALVVEQAGERVAIVANDLYIPQALLNARVATILEDRDRRIELGLEEGTPTGISQDNLMVSVSHSHSSPYYSTPSWGVWAFQDVFDIRFFEYVAQRTSEAVVSAAADLRPARLGATTVPFSATKRHSYGPAVADDGTPAGYPQDDTVAEAQVVRIDAAAAPHAAIATWVVFGLHPEMLDGNDLLSGEYVHAMYRMVDRITGGVTLFTQNDVGTAEPARDALAHPPEARAEFSHKEYAQMERAAALLADAVLGARAAIASGDAVVPLRTDVPVAVRSEWFAPPSARAVPTVSSCRAEKAFSANPGVPIVGLPDCAFPLEGAAGEAPADLRVTYDKLREAGIPVPDNTGAPSLTGLQETAAVHLQAIRLGPIGITVCPCEQWADQARNIESRLDREAGNLWLGFDWTTRTTPSGRPWCVPAADASWTCADPRTAGTTDLPPVSDLAYRRMVAQVGNDARGWDDPSNSLQAETDPADPARIWGNYTHEELTEAGYDLVITASMANDYWGYIASYREFQRGDHYRKALTGLGPHSSDFLATRLSRMAASLNGWTGDIGRTAKDDLYLAERHRLAATARAIGEAAARYVPLYEATLPADGGVPAIVDEPGDVERFAAARISWIGGSNWFDLPDVRIERRDDATGGWVPFGDLTGEVQALVHYPQADSDLVAWRLGQFEWRWEATFEAFASDLVLADPTGALQRSTPAGTYRFVIDGVRHAGGGQRVAYHLESATFDVRPWTGITAVVALDGEDGVTVTVGPLGVHDHGAAGTYTTGPIDYPDSYASPFRFIQPDREVKQYGSSDPRRHQQFCFHCSFRPWLDAGDAAAVIVTVVRANHTVEKVAAVPAGGGRWVADAELDPGDRAWVAAGDVTDAFGNRNGGASNQVTA